MRNLKIFMAMLLVFGVAAASHAAEKNWSDQAELSYVDTGGNTETSTLSFKNELKYLFTDQITGTWKVGALSGKSNGARTAESYFTELRGDYLYTERIYFYGNLGWFKDTFAGIDSRFYLGPGAGYKFLLGPQHFLDAEAGLIYVNEDYTDDTNSDYLGARLFGKYAYAISETSKFTQSLEYLYNFDESSDYRFISETAITSALSTNYSLKISYTYTYDNMPTPATLDDTDTLLAMALVANF